ncbi:hypothetical protein [Microbacterium sp. KR10-403]|uniref:hypothetical protein n=1 Tax=Microbacterium sp. KR10-403 TaxID=3158581 RepID=UPI0032E4100C
MTNQLISIDREEQLRQLAEAKRQWNHGLLRHIMATYDLSFEDVNEFLLEEAGR